MRIPLVETVIKGISIIGSVVGTRQDPLTESSGLLLGVDPSVPAYVPVPVNV